MELHHTKHSRSPKIKGEMFSPSNISVGCRTISITVSVFVLELQLSPGAAPAAGAAAHHEGSLVVEVEGHRLQSLVEFRNFDIDKIFLIDTLIL